MPIIWRPATCLDIEPGISIQPNNRGDALVGGEAAVACWRYLATGPFFASAVLESTPVIRGHRMVGFGASVLVSSAFADSEIALPRPDMNSRIIASIQSDRSVLATQSEVARANAGVGVDVVVLYGTWRDEILSPSERQDVQTLLASSFTEWHAGYRIRRIFHETCDEPGKEFLQRSVVYQAIAEFSDHGRILHLMTRDSVKAMPASLGNVLFFYREPILRLRDSDRQLLQTALGGATDLGLATELGLTFSAVKARWRSTFARIAEIMPALVSDVESHQGRGMQKRHRVLSYVRSHPEELKPYDWKTNARP
jgi:hypothetical protein